MKRHNGPAIVQTHPPFFVFSTYARWLDLHPCAQHSASRKEAKGAPSEYSPTAPLTESSPTSPRSSVTRIRRRTGCWWPAT